MAARGTSRAAPDSVAHRRCRGVNETAASTPPLSRRRLPTYAVPCLAGTASRVYAETLHTWLIRKRTVCHTPAAGRRLQAWAVRLQFQGMSSSRRRARVDELSENVGEGGLGRRG